MILIKGYGLQPYGEKNSKFRALALEGKEPIGAISLRG
jgi:hypothetical protein